MCSCDEEETPPSTGPGPSKYILRLRDTVGAEQVDMKWRRMNGQARSFSDRPGAVFIFGDQASATGLTLTRVSP
jgi:hypothetical protein